MDKSAGQSRLSRAQLPPQGAGDPSLSLDQLSDLDQAISLSRSGRSEPRPAPIITRSAPRPPVVKPAPVTPKPTSASKPSKTPTPQTPPQDEPPAIPVRSAKEAINAMYAAENPARLSDYLGTSAKEIINAAARNNSDRDTKSAASLHHASSQRRMEASRPSASAIFRAAKSETTVVRTSLELDPKSPRTAKSSKPSPIIINSRSRAARPQVAPRPVDSVRPKKGQIKITTPSATSVAVSAIEQAAGAVTGATAARNNSDRAAKTAVRPKSPRPRNGLVQDIARPARQPGNSSHSSEGLAHQAEPSRSVKSASERPGSSRLKPFSRAPKTAQNDPYQKLPTDSVKRRFRLAPKGFAAQKPEQARPARRKFMSFSNPDYSVPIPKPTPAVEIYGMTEPDPKVRSKDGLGVVEDYRPSNPANPAMGTSASDRATTDSDIYEVPGAVTGATAARNNSDRSAKSAKAAKASNAARAQDSASGDRLAPDNNRYTLGGQSPFFLKTVNVEKRPLSDAPTRRADTISPIYTDRGDELPRKNVYDGKSAAKSAKSGKSTKKGSPRDLPQRPTVIIPSSRRSHTPLFLLLILTVILGAAVGAAVYFFFFQPTLNDTPSTSSRITVESQEY